MAKKEGIVLHADSVENICNGYEKGTDVLPGIEAFISNDDAVITPGSVHDVHKRGLANDGAVYDPIEDQPMGILLKYIQESGLGIPGMLRVIALYGKGICRSGEDGRTVKQQRGSRHYLRAHKVSSWFCILSNLEINLLPEPSDIAKVLFSI